MRATPVHLLAPDETERLRALRHYEIRHSLHEAIFDEYVKLAARLFNLPISLIALVDTEEVEYMANQGLPGLLTQPRVEALCAVAVSRGQATILADLSSDDDELTPEAEAAARTKHLRFYAGVPLRMPDHRDIGTLCVIDRRPRTFSADEQQLLEHLAALVARTIVVRHCCLTNPALGEAHWQLVQAQLVEEALALVALVRYLTTRSGTQVPVAPAIIEPVRRRLNDLDLLLSEYATSL